MSEEFRSSISFSRPKNDRSSRSILRHHLGIIKRATARKHLIFLSSLLLASSLSQAAFLRSSSCLPSSISQRYYIDGPRRHHPQHSPATRKLLLQISGGGGAGGDTDKKTSTSSSSGCTTSPNFDGFASFIQAQQKDIIATLEEEEGKGGARFVVDEWTRGETYGATCVLEGGSFIEKGAVSVSIVKGTLSPERAAAMSSRGRNVGGEGGTPYAAAALSLVLHSANPHLPTFRSDVRYFECQGKGWFGGGADLTPYYLHEQDIISFHALYKGLCDAAGGGGEEGDALYPKYKKWCDDYFYLPGRQEHRGVGGIFFDDLESLKSGLEGKGGDEDDADEEEEEEAGKKRARGFTEAVALSFMPSFIPIVRRRREEKFTEEQKQWMLLRRGRYLEFNLLYDRGVKFGLAGGRFESVMVSAPPLAAWKYNHVPKEGSPEAAVMAVLKKPRDWV